MSSLCFTVVYDVHQMMNDVTSRSEFLLLSMAAALMPSSLLASVDKQPPIEWNTFVSQMRQLSDSKLAPGLLAEQGAKSLQQLNLDSAEFEAAENEAFETGNQYWMWQRMLKDKNLNGGILNIDSEQLVQLHDHPGATGVLRIISGETEVWQFDKVASSIGSDGQKTTELKRVSKRLLKPGDTAVLTPDSGNIHALKAVSKQCRMLDFFIPPYQRSQRSWYEPLEKDWFNSETITCRSIPQDEYAEA